MSLIRGIALDLRSDLDLLPSLARIRDTGFNRVFVVIESEEDEIGIGRVAAAVRAFEAYGLRTVAHLVDGSRGLECLSREQGIQRKIRRIRRLARSGISGIVFGGFGTRCYFCEQCASGLERATGLSLPRLVIGNEEEARKWRYPDPWVHGFDSPYNCGTRLEEVLQVEEWMGDRLADVASRVVEAVAEVSSGCTLGLVGLNPIGREVLAMFSRHCVPMVLLMSNTYILSNELELYIRKFPFEGLDRRWSSVAATSAYYHTPEELGRIIIKSGLEGRFGTIVWAAGKVGLSFGRLSDITCGHWDAIRQAFEVVRSYEADCEQAESGSGMHWTRKAETERAALD